MTSRWFHTLLLAAPLAAAVGCNSFGGRFSQVQHGQPRLSAAQSLRLQQLAEAHEQQGNHAAALQTYQALAANDAGNPIAAERIAALSAKIDSAAAPQTVTADAAPSADPRSLPHDDSARELAAADPFAAAELVAPAPPPEEPVAEFKAPTAEASPEPVVADAEEPTPFDAAAPDAVQTIDDAAQENPFAAGDTSWWAEAAAPLTAAELTPFADEDAAAFTSSEATQIVDSAWRTTSLAHLCGDAPAILHEPLAQLDSRDAAERKAGLITLAAHRAHAAAAIPAIARLLDDDDALVRAHASWALAEITNEPAVSVATLAAQLSDQQDEVVQTAAYLLGTLGSRAAAARPALLTVCETGTPVARIHAAEALARISRDDNRPVQQLIDALHADDRECRWLAAVALMNVGEPHQDRVVNALCTALGDADSGVCSAAAFALGGLGPAAESAADDLETAAGHESSEVRDAAQAALQCIRR